MVISVPFSRMKQRIKSEKIWSSVIGALFLINLHKKEVISFCWNWLIFDSVDLSFQAFVPNFLTVIFTQKTLGN